MTVRDVFATEQFPLLEVGLWDAFVPTVDRDADAIAVIGESAVLTRGQLLTQAESCAAGLAAQGVRHGSSLLFRSESDHRSAVVALAAARLGAQLAIIPATMGIHETRLIRRLVEPDAMICPDRASAESWESESAPAVDLNVLLAEDPGGAGLATPLSVDRASVMGFTAGTTGKPKGVVHTAASLNYVTARWAERVGLTVGDRILASMPLSYMAGYAFSLHLSLSRGVTLVTMRKWDAAHAIRMTAEHGCCWSMTVPSQVVMLIDAARQTGLPDNWGTLRCITCGGSPMHDSLSVQVSEVLGATLLRAYGLSEYLGAAMMPPSATLAERQRHDGAAILNTDIEAFDENGVMLPRGTVGIGGVRGPGLMLGYVGDAKTTNDFNGSGFLMTGDLIVREVNGLVKVVGRVRDMIIRGGLNIDPVEIENLIATHPAVRSVVVVGYPDHRLGEKVGVAASLVTGASLSLEDIVEFLTEVGLSKQKLPQRYLEVDEIPLSSLGKPLKDEIRRLLVGSDGSVLTVGVAAGAGESSISTGSFSE